MDKEHVIQALAALAHPVRLDAFRALVVAGHDGLAQKALAEAVGVGPTNLAFHLKELSAAGLVTQAQTGLEFYLGALANCERKSSKRRRCSS